jgi:Arc/MetJ-type ribon-helix-helix transcriptional regulator
MSNQLAIRFSDEDLEGLTALVAAGIAPTRSKAVRAAVQQFIITERRRALLDAEAASWADFPETADEMERAHSAGIAACAAEDWTAIYAAGSDA